jgi:hypothetical protein
MAKNSLEIVAMAHRRLGLLSVDETPSADQDAFATEVLIGILGELETVHQISISEDSVPDGLFLPVAYLLACDLAAHYDEPARDSRAQMIARIRAAELPDDRPVRADLDDDGTVTDAEAYVDGQAAYY